MRGLDFRSIIYISSRFKVLWGHSYGKIGLIIVGSLVAMAILAPLISPYDPNYTDVYNRLSPPSTKHILGTDHLGRDILSRIIWGSRISLFIAAVTVFMTSSIGLLVGLISGYRGGRVDLILMRVTDIFMSFPSLILALAISSMLGPGLFKIIIAISVVYWSHYARLVRGVVLQIREELYIYAAKAIGASDIRVMFRHILPMVLAPLIVRITLDMGGVILLAAGLGFLGVGVQPPTPEWGVMISEGRRFITREWWVSTFPGFFVMLATLGFNLIGDALRDILDVKMRR